MALPKKPNKTADDFIKGAAASKAEKTQVKRQGKGRPPGPPKVQFPVRLPADLLETIRENSSGNLSYFTEQVFRDYFKRNNIEVI